MKITGVVQAGGKSTRMGGQPKALLEVGGRRIIDRVLDVLRAVTDEVLIVTNTPQLYASLSLAIVADVFPDHGSLGGIYSGLWAAGGDAAFTVACDMPFLTPEVARLVIGRARQADVVVPEVAGRLETLHALYARACLPHMEERLRRGELRITDFFDRVRVLRIPESEVARWRDPAVAFMNVNTPCELAEARRLAAALDGGWLPSSGGPAGASPTAPPTA
jgi:molybdopterin-guanine dinucleotide biosynthesis protein A